MAWQRVGRRDTLCQPPSYSPHLFPPKLPRDFLVRNTPLVGHARMRSADSGGSRMQGSGRSGDPRHTPRLAVVRLSCGERSIKLAQRNVPHPRRPLVPRCARSVIRLDSTLCQRSDTYA